MGPASNVRNRRKKFLPVFLIRREPLKASVDYGKTGPQLVIWQPSFPASCPALGTVKMSITEIPLVATYRRVAEAASRREASQILEQVKAIRADGVDDAGAHNAAIDRSMSVDGWCCCKLE